jgi:hypothetical protein
MNRRAPRPDIVYISRRTKRIEPAGSNDDAIGSAVHAEPPGVSISGSSTERPTGPLNLARPLRDGEGSSRAAAPSSPSRSSTENGLTLRPSPATGAASTSADYVAGSPRSLNLVRHSTGIPSPREATAEPPRRPQDGVSSLLFPAPSFASVRHISQETPVVRLNSRQAGIGTLLVSGAQSTAWEGTDLTTGAECLNGQTMGTTIFTRGNRPLVAFHEGSVAVALRHLRHLRRAIFIAARAPLMVRLFDGAAAAVLPAISSDEIAILYLTRIGEVIELRAEYVADSNYEKVWADFGFRMTTPVGTHGAGH